eukprot:CAMPEP_0180098082 /NCGR_PEP_ID=MMETSP0985-20121206/27563_1 /TAXON_ID=483367 /ORGANISM="non described non described, Strain CCMP 2436" /LENGTH=97 /DNA_ID=CAMNT_0022033503 /DNA_START=550 /DNA_END=842 /DNA_ORIENTATION=-
MAKMRPMVFTRSSVIGSIEAAEAEEHPLLDAEVVVGERDVRLHLEEQVDEELEEGVGPRVRASSARRPCAINMSKRPASCRGRKWTRSAGSRASTAM